jgi:23S rRNA (uridine2552-2'-O)-methyltransferase
MLPLRRTRFCFTHGKKAWFLNHINDEFVKKAHSLGFRSRASFKLLEIEQKFSLF